MRIDPESFGNWRLKPGAEVVEVDDAQILLRTFSGTLMLSGELMSAGLAQALKEAGTSSSLADLRELTSDQYAGEFESFVELLGDRNLLVEVSPGQSIGHDEAYWLTQQRGIEAVHKSLKDCRVAVAGSGSVASSAARALAVGGVGRIVLAGDRHGGVDTPAAELQAHGCQVDQLVGQISDSAAWEGIVSTVDLVALCADDMSLAAYDRTNELCVRHGTRWTSARIDRTHGIMGPFVVPGETACYACFELRSRANADHPGDHAALSEHRKLPRPDRSGSWPVALEFGSILGNALALDIRRVLGGGFVSTTFGRVLEIDFHSLETHSHEVLKLPRCPVCTRLVDRPLSRIWDLPGGKLRAPAMSDPV